MDRLLFIFCCMVLAATPAGAASDEAKARAGVNASVDGGASLGGTGIANTPRGPGLRVPDEGQGRIRIPLGRPRNDDASAGASSPERRSGTDLGFEAEKEEEEFLKKQRTAPLKPKAR